MANKIDVTAGGEQGQEADGDVMGAGGEGGENQESEVRSQKSEDNDDGTEELEEGHDEPEEDGQHKLTEKQQAKVDKRIGKEVAKRKALEERATQAETELKTLRERADAEDADIVLNAASEFNILPEVIGKGQAEGMLNLKRAKDNQKFLRRALDRADGDEITIQGKTYTRAEVKESLWGYEEQVEKLEPKYGGVEREAKKRMLEIVRLGQAAARAGWKPGQKETTRQGEEVPQKPVKPPARAGQSQDEGDEPPARVRREEKVKGGQDTGGKREGESMAQYFDRLEREKAKAQH
jgi:hypothetical protein